RAQVPERRARSAAPDATLVPAGRDQALDGPGGRLRVRPRPGLQRKAPVGVLVARDEPGRPGDGAAPRPSRRDERLERAGGVVDAARRPAPGEVPTAVAVLLAREPRRRPADGPVVRRPPGGAQREDRERRAVDEALEGPVGPPAA